MRRRAEIFACCERQAVCSPSLRRHGAIARVRAANSVTHAAHESGPSFLEAFMAGGREAPRAKVN